MLRATCWPVVLPDVLEGFGERLSFYVAIRMTGVGRKDELVMVAFGGKNSAIFSLATTQSW